MAGLCAGIGRLGLMLLRNKGEESVEDGGEHVKNTGHTGGARWLQVVEEWTVSSPRG